MSALAPSLLVATPRLTDPNFAQSVVLMLEHSAEGAMGLVINRPAGLRLGQVGRVQNLPVHRWRESDAVFKGGPVEPQRGFVLHDRRGWEASLEAMLGESMEVPPDLAVTASSAALAGLLGTAAGHWRLCLGYSGWGPGQLERELQEGAWLVAPADSAAVLGVPPEELWGAVLQSMGIEPHRLMHASGVH